MDGVVDVPVMGGVEKKTLLIGGAVALLVVILIVVIYFYMKSDKEKEPPITRPLPNSQTSPPPLPFPDGSVLRCEETGAISKLDNGLLRHYATWDSYVAAGKPAFTTVDCGVLAQIPKGPNM